MANLGGRGIRGSARKDRAFAKITDEHVEIASAGPRLLMNQLAVWLPLWLDKHIAEVSQSRDQLRHRALLGEPLPKPGIEDLV